MIWIILGLIAGGILGKVFHDDNYYSSFNSPIPSIFYVAIIGGMVGILMALVLGAVFTPTRVNVSRSYLGALNDTTSTQGAFFLGSGVIDEKQVFSYYKEIAPNEYKLSRIDASENVSVIQDNVGRPYVETVGRESTDSSLQFWYLSLSGYSLDHATFRVPEGSITNQVNLDAR